MTTVAGQGIGGGADAHVGPHARRAGDVALLVDLRAFAVEVQAVGPEVLAVAVERGLEAVELVDHRLAAGAVPRVPYVPEPR